MWQSIIVGLIVAAAAGYVLRSAWLTLFGNRKAGCGSGCGKCSANVEPPSPDRISLPQV